MEYQGESSQYYCNYPKVQLANASYVASRNNSRYVVSTGTFDNAPYHHQEPMPIVNSSSPDATSNMQHINCLSAISSQYVVSPQDMPMNKRIG
jgi:hypothetical protein